MARARQKKKVLLRRLAKRRTRYEAAPILDASRDLRTESRDSDESPAWLEIKDAQPIEV